MSEGAFFCTLVGLTVLCGLICAWPHIRERFRPKDDEAEVITAARPAQRALTNRELLAILNDDLLPKPAREATVSSITGFRQSHTR